MRAPRFVRLGFFRLLKWNPHWFRAVGNRDCHVRGDVAEILHTLGGIVGGIVAEAGRS